MVWTVVGYDQISIRLGWGVCAMNRPLDDDTFRLAVRHGTPTREGIAAGVQSILPLYHWREQRSYLPQDSTEVLGAGVDASVTLPG